MTLGQLMTLVVLLSAINLLVGITNIVLCYYGMRHLQVLRQRATTLTTYYGRR